MHPHLHLSASLNDAMDAHRRRSPAPQRSQAHWTHLIRLAELGGLDFVTLDGVRTLGILARAAGTTRSIGLVPTVSTLPTAPARPLTSAAARLAADSRSGWLLETTFPDAAEQNGPAEPAARLWNGRGDAAEEDGYDRIAARNAATNRFLDRDWLRGPGFRPPLPPLRAPAAARPRPPVAVVLDVHGPDRRWQLAARHADVILLDAEHPAAARVCRAALKRQAEEAGREPESLRVMVRLGVDFHPHNGTGLRFPADTLHFAGPPADLDKLLVDWHEGGVADGFHLLPVQATIDLLAVVHGLVPRLRGRGLLRLSYQSRTLRNHLGLAR